MISECFIIWRLDRTEESGMIPGGNSGQDVGYNFSACCLKRCLVCGDAKQESATYVQPCGGMLLSAGRIKVEPSLEDVSQFSCVHSR